MSTTKVSERGRVWRTLLTPIRLNPFGSRRKSLSHAIENSALPAPLQDLIHDVARRSKLWYSERLDVALELITHFHDGLASGASPENLISTFGDRTQAAALIRRAKKRCRPRVWRAIMFAWRGIFALSIAVVCLYALLAARAFLTSPTITRNYLAEINATINKVPEPDRAWPLYRSAYLAQPRIPKAIIENFPGISPQDPAWPAAVAYIKECEPALDLIRRAASRPSMGRPLSNVLTDFESDVHSFWLSGFDMEKARTEAQAQADSFTLVPDTNPELIGVLLPHLGTLRHFARLLAFDAKLAATTGDAARVHADLQALYRMSTHTRDDGFLISQLVCLAIQDLASQEFGKILRDDPVLLSNDQLVSLAHLASRSPLAIDFGNERCSKGDLIQRIYSDDGHGNGHLTAQGYRLLKSYMSADSQKAELMPFETLMVPAVSGLSPSRRELSDLVDGIYDRASRYATTPTWKRADADDPSENVEKLVTGPVSRVRYMLVSILTPAITKAVWRNDEAAQRRGVVTTAVALELHRRKYGSHPNSLAEIEPSILPAIPLDMFDGKPLRYTLHDGKPVLYSIGVDRKDDGGRAPKKLNYSIGTPDRWKSVARSQAILNDPNQRHAIDGDWILWPLPPDPVPKAKSGE